MSHFLASFDATIWDMCIVLQSSRSQVSRPVIQGHPGITPTRQVGSLTNGRLVGRFRSACATVTLATIEARAFSA
jgi:hypothetical protein